MDVTALHAISADEPTSARLSGSPQLQVLRWNLSEGKHGGPCFPVPSVESRLPRSQRLVEGPVQAVEPKVSVKFPRISSNTMELDAPRSTYKTVGNVCS